MRTKIMITTLLAASLMLSCNPKEILEPTNLVDLNFSIIDGDTVKTRKDNIIIPQRLGIVGLNVGDTIATFKDWKLNKKNQDKNVIDRLKKDIEDPDLKGKPLRMVVVGGSLAAGVRNGGYNNENLSTSFPNLIALQMGIDFYQPYFDNADYNGFGTSLKTNENITGGPLPKFKTATNNLAIENIDANGKIKLKPFKGGRIDNFSLNTFSGFEFPEYFGGIRHNDSEPIYKRLFNNERYDKRVLKEKFDFILDCSNLGYTGYLGIQTGNKYFNGDMTTYRDERGGGGMFPNYSEHANFLIEIKKRKGLKGVIYNFPAPSYLPAVADLFKVEDVKKQLAIYQKTGLLESDIKYLYPYQALDSLMGKNVNMNIKPYISNNKQIFGSTRPQQRNERMNKQTRMLAEYMNFAFVDIEDIFIRAYEERLFSVDNLKISKAMFFAEDGMSPTVLGNVIIANETIKVINNYYGIAIPYLNTRDFLK
ncbi:hypothetical protein EGI22_10225 [Lacihabitans sp. LS3-19]|uniref:hypothetical protein n=1 Tax=Lacihabitans sp. LS3-19 TaxID=2487335 RepID=UPI0020CEF8C1|nr:hypothetical protein [Lacihabitans sp. LS3-19]MCP9768289.1 hypothetical protein [Lacihabitans sp. LS3-19]